MIDCWVTHSFVNTRELLFIVHHYIIRRRILLILPVPAAEVIKYYGVALRGIMVRLSFPHERGKTNIITILNAKQHAL